MQEKWYYKIFIFLWIVQKMNTEISIFGGVAIEKCKFHFPKNPIQINDLDIYKILISNKVSFCKIGYQDNEKVIQLCITLPKMIGYAKSICLY